MSKRRKKIKDDVKFPGYEYWDSQRQFIKYPMILQEYWWALTGSEQKVLDMVVRQTFAWKRQSDIIALSQFTDGIKKNRGTGLSRSQVKRAIDSLEKRGFIEVERFDRRASKFTMPVSIAAKEQKRLEIEHAERIFISQIKESKFGF